MKAEARDPGAKADAARRVLLIGAALAAVAAFAGCGNLTAGGASEVEVVMASDESGSAASAAAPTASADGPDFTPAPLIEGTLDGHLRVELSVRLTDVEGATIDLTAGAQEVVVPLAPGARTPVTLVAVPAGEYASMAATFTRVRAEAAAGPGGTPVEFELDFSGGPFEAAASESFALAADERMRLVVDLRAGMWVLTPAAERLAAFRNAVSLSVEPGD